jgi:spoIIIJ-associated protein
MESLEVRAKTVEEAIQRGLQQTGLNRDEVEIVVIREGRSGILGLGAEEAIVRVTPLASEPAPVTTDLAATARNVLEQLLVLLGVTASIETQSRPVITENNNDEASSVEASTGEASPIALDIKGEDLGILIGRRGQTLAALQYIVRLLVGRQNKTWAPIVIDVEGYKQRRYQALESFARDMAERVRQRGASFTLEPMPPYERRIVHLTLAEHPHVMTESIGQGDDRKVVIIPKKK